MNVGLFYLAHGVIFSVCSVVSMLSVGAVFSNVRDPDPVLVGRRRNTAFGCALLSVMIGTAVSGHGLEIVNICLSVVGVCTMSCVAYTDFGRIRVPFWFSGVGLVLVLIVGLFNQAPLMIVDGLVTALPFGLSALLLRDRRVFVPETITCAFLGSFFGMGFGLVVVTLGAAIAALTGRKHIQEIQRIRLQGWMSVVGLVVTFVASVLTG